MEFNNIGMDIDPDPELCDIDSDFDLEEDTEKHLEDLKQLSAVLEEDEDLTGVSTSQSLTNLLSSISSKSNASTTNTLAKIDAALSCNKLTDEKVRRLEKILTMRLKECRQKLQVIQGTSCSMGEKNEVFRYINCGRPYFKDRLNFPAPENDDAKMAKSQMYDFSLVISVPGWTVRDKSQFITMIHKMSIDLRKNELTSKIAHLKRQQKLNPIKKVENEIAAIKKEIDNVSKQPLIQVALPIDEEYDWDMLANRLNKRHTAQEYQALWKLFFHPSINKNSWSKSEHSALQRIASDNNQQDWESIAQQLGTGRTEYQCFVYYRTNMSNQFTGKKWSDEEVTYLRRLIEYFKEDSYIPWGKIAAAMENRTKIQIYNKYLRLIEIRKGRFLPEEDAVILNCVERFGTNFKRMTSYLPGRSMVQIRSRYHVLSRMRVSTVWTVADDKKLIQIMTNQDANVNYSTITHYFPGRNRVNIRTRYLTLTRWMKKHPNLDLDHAPRRGARRLNHGQATEDLSKAIENLKNTLSSQIETRSTRKRIGTESSEHEIDDAIVAVLVNELVKQIEAKKTPTEGQQVVLGNNYTVALDKLNTTNLHKCLLCLRARLIKSDFDKSKFSKQFPDLGNRETDVSLVRLKSYSRKNTAQTVQCNDKPNIWVRNDGTFYCSPTKYVLPPNYATITGCRSLMAHIPHKYLETLSLHLIVKRNSYLKDQMHLLIERFYTLFTWPMLLSNEGPYSNPNLNVNKIDSPFVRPPSLPSAPAVTINVKCIKKFKNQDVAEVIDLDDEETNKPTVTVVEKFETSDKTIEKLLK